MPDPYVPNPDDPVEANPVVFRPTTFGRHARAVNRVLGDNQARYPRVGRGRTTKPSSGTWGSLASGHSISAASGLTLGSGTVTLCSRSGDTLTADGEDITVYNAGGVITGPKVLELDWTDGVWAVCECGGSGLTCCGCTNVPTTLTYTNSILGTCVLTYVVGSINPRVWLGVLNYSYPGVSGIYSCNGNFPCFSAVINISVSFEASGIGSANCAVFLGWGFDNVVCPTNTGGAVSDSAGMTTASCSPFLATGVSNSGLPLICPAQLLYNQLTGAGINHTLTP